MDIGQGVINLSFHSTLFESSKYLAVHRARIVINASTALSPPNNNGIFNAFQLRKDRYFMPSFGLFVLISYTGSWNWSGTLQLKGAAAESAAVGNESVDNPVFTAGLNAYGTLVDMAAVSFNAGDSNNQIPGQIGCGQTTGNSISLTQRFPPGKFILIRNSGTSLPATTITVDFFLKGYYLDI